MSADAKALAAEVARLEKERAAIVRRLEAAVSAADALRREIGDISTKLRAAREAHDKTMPTAQMERRSKYHGRLIHTSLVVIESITPAGGLRCRVVGSDARVSTVLRRVNDSSGWPASFQVRLSAYEFLVLEGVPEDIRRRSDEAAAAKAGHAHR